jgi:hypothetical protein
LVGRVFTALVLTPRLAQPLAVGLKASCSQHTGTGLDAFASNAAIGLFVHDRCGHKTALVQFDAIHLGVVVDLHTQLFGAAVKGIHQGLAPAHEKRVGAGRVQSARQRRLKTHTMLDHPGSAGGRMADRQPGQVLVGQAARDFEQVLPKLFFRVGIDQHVLRRIVHAAQIAGVARIAAAPLARGRFEQHHAGTRLRGP